MEAEIWKEYVKMTSKNIFDSFINCLSGFSSCNMSNLDSIIRWFPTYLCDVTWLYPGPFLMKYRSLVVSWASRTSTKKVTRVTKTKCRSSKICSSTPDGCERWIQFVKSVFSSKMESFIHLFEASSGSGTQTARASMPECLPPEVNIKFLRPFYPHFCPLSKLLLSDLVQVEEGNVEYKVSVSQRIWCCW